MNNYNEENAFSFGDIDEKSLKYDHISGLGESDYENEDLFNDETSSLNAQNRVNNDYIGEPFNSGFEALDSSEGYEIDGVSARTIVEPETSEMQVVENSEELQEEVLGNSIPDAFEDAKFEAQIDEKSQMNTNESGIIQNEEPKEKEFEVSNEEENKMFDTYDNDLNKLTEYKEEKINPTDIKSLFDKVGVNVKEASDIFKKNTEMKEKLDTRFEELKKLKLEIEKTKKTQYDEINNYKEEVLSKLTDKKEEIEKRLNKLKEFQTNLEKEKAEFEEYRKNEKEEIERVQKEILESYDSRRDELTHIEDVLRRQKDALDEERSQLSLDMIQYEADKNELANNLLKFNEIVASFTNGMEKIEKE